MKLIANLLVMLMSALTCTIAIQHLTDKTFVESLEIVLVVFTTMAVVIAGFMIVNEISRGES